MRLLLEVDKNVGKIRLARANEEGFLVSQRDIATIENSDTDANRVAALKVAKVYGWAQADEWGTNEDGTINWCYVEPTPIKISFVGADIPNELALAYAKAADYKVTSVIDREPLPDEGKIAFTFTINEPHGWSYESFTTNEPFDV